MQEKLNNYCIQCDKELSLAPSNDTIKSKNLCHFFIKKLEAWQNIANSVTKDVGKLLERGRKNESAVVSRIPGAASFSFLCVINFNETHKGFYLWNFMWIKE